MDWATSGCAKAETNASPLCPLHPLTGHIKRIERDKSPGNTPEREPRIKTKRGKRAKSWKRKWAKQTECGGNPVGIKKTKKYWQGQRKHRHNKRPLGFDQKLRQAEVRRSGGRGRRSRGEYFSNGTQQEKKKGKDARSLVTVVGKKPTIKNNAL